MRRKIFLLLSILTAVLFLTGCSKELSNDVLRTSKEIAYNWVNTANYQCPDGYEVNNASNRNDQITIRNKEDNTCITYNITADNNVEIDNISIDLEPTNRAAIIGTLVCVMFILTAIAIIVS